MIIDRAMRDNFPYHFFQALRLRGKLNVVVGFFALLAMFVFDRINATIWMKFNHIAFSY